MNKRFRIPAFGLATMAALALFGGSASALVTVGQVAPVPDPEIECGALSGFDEFQRTVVSGASYAVPAPGGVLTSWSTNAGPGAGQKFELKVFRPTGPNSYLVVAHDGLRALTPGVLNTFPVSIPVLPGDVVGMYLPSELESAPTVCFFETGDPLDIGAWRAGNNPDGSTITVEGEEGEFRENISATLLPPPTVGGIGTTSGSIQGGTPVLITGANFAQVKGVSFGATPATFAVNSEGQITATSPPSTTLSSVPITVTTVAGAISSATTFTYVGCKVPKLSGKKLKASKKALKKGDCKLGKVKKVGDATAKTGKVVKQNPKPGKILVPGSKVGIKLG
jgi:hypothetical protein